MDRYFFVLVISMLFSLVSFAQRDSLNEIAQQPVEEILFTNPMEMPRFPGCEDLPTIREKKRCADIKMVEFIYGNFQYPQKSGCSLVSGLIVASFAVEPDGSLSNFKILRDIGGGMGEEALRVLRLMPNFIPGKQSGKVVSTQINVPIRICLE